eukprot:45151_1
MATYNKVDIEDTCNNISKNENSEQICKFYAQGKCNRGNLCRFKHETSIINYNLSKQQIICKFHAHGKCDCGSLCAHKHEIKANNFNTMSPQPMYPILTSQPQTQTQIIVQQHQQQMSDNQYQQRSDNINSNSYQCRQCHKLFQHNNRTLKVAARGRSNFCCNSCHGKWIGKRNRRIGGSLCALIILIFIIFFVFQ